MYFQIKWHLFLRVKNEIKADKLLKQFENATHLQIKEKTYGRLEDKSLFEAKFVTEYIDNMEINQAVFITLLLVNSIGTCWSVYSPKEGKDPWTNEIVWSFEGISNSPKITGITWGQFVLQTNTKLEYGWNY
ncbi:hypothetical protein [Paenibacillus periandrae]|uniref:hypothetical protein n=1 Tax=Paenibacillus periandrae TaxID=1761741 RepID=UPI001F09BB7E|nr:hypothetical protein [Paenibacillus periandrae]